MFSSSQAYSSSLSSKDLSLFHRGNGSVVTELDSSPTAFCFARFLAVCCLLQLYITPAHIFILFAASESKMHDGI